MLLLLFERNLAPNEEVKTNHRSSSSFFNYEITDTFLANQIEGNFCGSLEYFKISILTKYYESVNYDN